MIFFNSTGLTFSASCYRSNRSEINFFSSFWVFCTCKTRPSCNRNRNSFLFPLQCDLIWILGQWVNVLWWASGLETLLLVPLFGAVLCTLPIHAWALENVGRGILKVSILLQLSCICMCICICIHIFIFFLYYRPRRRNCWRWCSPPTSVPALLKDQFGSASTWGSTPPLNCVVEFAWGGD